METHTTLILNPRPLPRGLGNGWVIKVAGPAGEVIDLTGTVLHQMAQPGEVPVLPCAGQQFVLQPIESYRLKPTLRYDLDGKLVGSFIDLPDELQVIDRVLAGVLAGNLTGYQKEKALQDLAKVVWTKLEKTVLSSQTDRPGIMTTVLVDDCQLADNEVGTTWELARKLVRAYYMAGEASRPFFVQLSTRMPYSVCGVPVMDFVNGFVSDDNLLAKFLAAAVPAMDGMAAMSIRFPIAGSTSNSPCIARIYKESPSQAVYMSSDMLKKLKEGDCDGDRLGLYWLDGGPSIPPAPLTWAQDYSVAYGELDLDELQAPEAKHPLVVLSGAMHRSRVIGLLTDLFKQVIYCSGYHYRTLGFSCKEDAMLYHLDIFGCFVEEVMDARKGMGSGLASDGKGMVAEAAIACFTGKHDISEFISMIPISEDGKDGLKEHQVKGLHALLLVVSGGKDRVVLSSRKGGACRTDIMDAALRTNMPSVRKMLGSKTENLYDEVISQIMLEEVV